MFRTIVMICSFIIIAALFLFIAPAGAYADYPEVTADAAVLMDAATGQVFYAKNSYKQRPPASLTKIMTAVIALENGRPGEVVTVSRKAASISEGSIIDLHPGEKITLHNLLKAALISSANDSTVAIAEHISGSEDRFIAVMNTKAALLGALNTCYANTNGYTHPNHYSTAYDLALIARYALKNPQFAKYVRSKEAVVEWYDRHRSQPVYNTNRLLFGGYPGISGVKTGSTSSAGNCLIASAGRDGRYLIAVVLHSGDRYRDAIKLLDYGFSQVESLDLCKTDEPVGRLAVRKGISPDVAVVPEKEVKVDLLRSDLPELQRKINLNSSNEAPVRARQKLGEAVFYLRGRELARVNLVAAEAVPRKKHPLTFDLLSGIIKA